MKKKNFILGLLPVAIFVTGVIIYPVLVVYAAALTTLSDTQSSLKINTLSDHTIQFVTPTGVSIGQSIAITFPAGYAMGLSNINNVDLATSGSGSCTGFTDKALAATPFTTTWGYSTSSQTITFTSGTDVILGNRCIQIEVGSNATFGGAGVTQITNPGTPGPYTVTIGGTMADSGAINVVIINDDTVAVTGTVQQSISFTISTSTIYFGTLGSSGAKFASSTNTSGDTVETVAHTLALGTNAPSGFALTARGQTLTSQQNVFNTISVVGATAASSTPGTEQFGFRTTVSGGTGITLDPTFSQASSYGYDGTATTSTLIASGTGSTATATFSVRYLANIASITEAGTYAANLVYIATANF